MTRQSVQGIDLSDVLCEFETIFWFRSMGGQLQQGLADEQIKASCSPSNLLLPNRM